MTLTRKWHLGWNVLSGSHFERWSAFGWFQYVLLFGYVLAVPAFCLAVVTVRLDEGRLLILSWLSWGWV